jgi:uridine kinase
MSEATAPLVIGIAGGTGSGKSTVASVILSRVGKERIAFLLHDAYYRDRSHIPFPERAEANFDHPDQLETSLLVKHIGELRAGQPVEMPVYDFKTHSRTDRTVRVEPRPVIIVEGILLFAEPELRACFDIRLFVDTDADVRFIRRLQRDIAERGRNVESVISQYQATVRPMHLEFVEPSKRWADVIIPEGGLNTVAIDIVVARVESRLPGA